MKSPDNIDPKGPDRRRSSGCLRLIKTSSIFIIIIILIIAGWVKYNIYASPFTPVKLTGGEQEILDSKLALLQQSSGRNDLYGKDTAHDVPGALKPEKYSEEGARREISLTEKELNAMIANTPDTARRVAIDLSQDLVSIKLVVPVDEKFLFFGGKTLRIHIGSILSYDSNGPVVAVKGVSLGGIPMPNAWLGYIKEKNLVNEFRSEGGFWQLFSEGVNDIKVKDGHILVRLNT